MGGKVLIKTTKNKTAETSTGITSKNGKYANENKLSQGDTNSDCTRKIIICSQAGKIIILVGSNVQIGGRPKHSVEKWENVLENF